MEGKENTKWWQPALLFYGKVTGWIVLPLLIAYFLTHSIWVIMASFLVTVYGIYREIKLYKISISTDKEKTDGK